MSTTLQIKEVAERSGFTPATLRYYEQIGLLTPAARSDAGYRLYDDTSLERLRFIARAKQLGCSLDEIAELASVRDGGRCATVQERLRATVETKIAEAHGQIAAMTALAVELRLAAAALSTDPLDGPCDASCACTADDAAPAPAPARSTTASLTSVTPDAPDDDAAVACTLGRGDMAARLDDWAALLDGTRDPRQGVTARLALDGGLRLELGPNTDVAEIARLAAAEQACCRFFDFALVVDGRGIALEVHAPAEGQPVLAALFGVAA